MIPNPAEVLETTTSRSDEIYLAVIIILFAATVLILGGGLFYRLWKELRDDIRSDRKQMRRSMDSVAATNLTVQEMLAMLHLTGKKDGPQDAVECQELRRTAEELMRIQESQRIRLERLAQQ